MKNPNRNSQNPANLDLLNRMVYFGLEVELVVQVQQTLSYDWPSVVPCGLESSRDSPVPSPGVRESESHCRGERTSVRIGEPAAALVGIRGHFTSVGQDQRQTRCHSFEGCDPKGLARVS
jgi:hypothetical protein